MLPLNAHTFTSVDLFLNTNPTFTIVLGIVTLQNGDSVDIRDYPISNRFNSRDKQDNKEHNKRMNSYLNE